MVHCSRKINDFAPSLQRVCPKGRQIVLYLSFLSPFTTLLWASKAGRRLGCIRCKKNLINFYGLHWVDLTKPDNHLINRAEMTQADFTRGQVNPFCEQRLDRLNLFSLQHKSMREDKIETYKILSGLEYANSSQFFTRPKMNNLRWHSKKLYKENLHKVVLKAFFNQRVIDQWNGLPEATVTAKTLNRTFQEGVR